MPNQQNAQRFSRPRQSRVARNGADNDVGEWQTNGGNSRLDCQRDGWRDEEHLVRAGDRRGRVSLRRSSWSGGRGGQSVEGAGAERFIERRHFLRQVVERTPELDAAADQLMLRVAEAYFNVLTAIDALVFARAEERAVGRQLDQADQRFEVGLTAITDVHEARARYDQSRAGAITAENSLNDAREALAEITGEYLQNFEGLGPEFEPTLPQPSDIAAWVETALAENPTLHARELALVAAGHDVATARSGHLPTLGAFVDYGDTAGWGASRFGGLEVPADSTGYSTTIGVQLNVPIFSGFATSARVRQSVHSRDAVEDELEQQRQVDPVQDGLHSRRPRRAQPPPT